MMELRPDTRRDIPQRGSLLFDEFASEFIEGHNVPDVARDNGLIDAAAPDNRARIKGAGIACADAGSRQGRVGK
ncbi:MAG: hypothetical protein ACREFU_21540 [Acetobacteraceae bacterium]